MDKIIRDNLIQRVAVGDIFRRLAATSGDKTAVVEFRGGERVQLTHSQLNQSLNRFVRAMRENGFQKGDRIALLCLNSIEFIIALYGCAKGGFVAIPVNPGLSPKQIAYILEHAQASCLIADDQLVPVADQALAGLSNITHKIALPVTGSSFSNDYTDLNLIMEGKDDSEIEDVVIEDRDTFEILYTSGTTADPKGVMVSHLSVFIMSLTNVIEMNLHKGFHLLNLLPLFHCAQQTFTTSCLHTAGQVVVMRAFEPGTMLKTIEENKIQVIFCLPAMYRALLDHPRIKETDLSSVEKCVYAMTPMDQRTLSEAIKVFGADFLLGTGQTECFPSTNTFHPEWQLKKSGNYWGESALTLDTAVMDDNGNLLPPNQVGEIVWRGPAVMNGYLKNPEATEATRLHGWHHSGDLGYFDDDRLLAFVDRKKDMIKSGGENVPSIKVERTILADPRVAAVCVVGLPHEKWIEAVTAFVEPAPGAQITEEEILSLCSSELGKFEIPKKIIFVKELPKTSTGKLQKHIIRKQYSNLYQE
jgi:long-chain acyl-CoA synthetase